jgi:hypothetical protein
MLPQYLKKKYVRGKPRRYKGIVWMIVRGHVDLDELGHQLDLYNHINAPPIPLKKEGHEKGLEGYEGIMIRIR